MGTQKRRRLTELNVDFHYSLTCKTQTKKPFQNVHMSMDSLVLVCPCILEAWRTRSDTESSAAVYRLQSSFQMTKYKCEAEKPPEAVRSE